MCHDSWPVSRSISVTVTPGTPVPDLVSWPLMTGAVPAGMFVLEADAVRTAGPVAVEGDGDGETVGEVLGLTDACTDGLGFTPWLGRADRPGAVLE